MTHVPKVDAMVDELNRRKVSRGNIGQMLKAEEQEKRMEEMDQKLDAIIRHLGISFTPTVKGVKAL